MVVTENANPLLYIILHSKVSVCRKYHTVHEYARNSVYKVNEINDNQRIFPKNGDVIVIAGYCFLFNGFQDSGHSKDCSYLKCLQIFEINK